MRALGLLGVVLALAIVGMLMKKQLGGIGAPAPQVSSPVPGAHPPSGTVRQQSQQVQQQYKQAIDAAMQQAPRDVPDDAR